jgi:hypothetical protein
MDTSSARASLRVVKTSSPKLTRQPEIKAPKAEANYAPFAAAAVLAVALVLLGLSLSHLAAGIALVTGAGPSDGWLMAFGTDLGFVGWPRRPISGPS